MKFYALFAQIVARTDITSSAKVLSAVVCSRSLDGGATQLSYSLAAMIAGMTISMARRGLLQLCEKGIIKRTETYGPGRGCTYEVPGLEIEGFQLSPWHGGHRVRRVIKFHDFPRTTRTAAMNLVEAYLDEDADVPPDDQIDLERMTGNIGRPVPTR